MAARYRKIDPRIWNDAKFRTLSNDGKLVFLFILTHPHMTSLGAMRGSLPGLASELGWLPKAFAKAFREASQKGLLEHDEDTSFVGVPKFLKYNGPESPNVVKSWVSSWELIPECKLKDELPQRLTECLEGFGEGFRKAFAEIEKAFLKSMPYPEQEQEPEPKTKGPKRPGVCTVEEVATYVATRKIKINPAEFIDYYQARGWKVKGGGALKDWKAAVRTWERHQKNGSFSKGNPPPEEPKPDYIN